ncbi:hypothetical protein QJS10_CPA08g01271 [Acorus calamus]|uniref:Protein ARV n=1 Tax=Acorus calamus TaxID=4465 RepID=A0AAV9ECM3_ACOCL|nr:hypothetical protein QJS10_CPA08g01271 [Acorus calamus]
MGLRCIHCGSEVKKLYVQYSPGNIRLMKCENCKEVADHYIECEFMIILIDLILHKQKAYRHLLYNVLTRDVIDAQGILWKSSLSYLMLDTYRYFLLSSSIKDLDSSGYSLFSLWICGKILLNVMFGNFVFSSILLLATWISSLYSEIARYEDILLAIIVSSYFKIFLVAMMVWDFPSSVHLIIDLFILSSNIVALKVLTKLSITQCIGLCLSAHAAKFLTYWSLPL